MGGSLRGLLSNYCTTCYFDESSTGLHLERTNVYLNKAAKGRYISRVILINLGLMCSLSAPTSISTKLPKDVCTTYYFDESCTDVQLVHISVYPKKAAEERYVQHVIFM